MSSSLITENFTEYWLFGQQTISEVIANYTVAFNEIFLQIFIYNTQNLSVYLCDRPLSQFSDIIQTRDRCH